MGSCMGLAGMVGAWTYLSPWRAAPGQLSVLEVGSLCSSLCRTWTGRRRDTGGGEAQDEVRSAWRGQGGAGCPGASGLDSSTFPGLGSRGVQGTPPSRALHQEHSS